MNWDLLNRNISTHKLGEISPQTVILLLLIAAVITGFFYLFKRYVLPFLSSRRSRKKTRILIYRIEVICWIVYVVFGLYQLLSDSLYITLALLIVVILAGRNFWKDLFAGIAFRLENKFQEGDPVKYDSYSGVLHEISRRNVQIKTDKEELVTVPFRKISSAVLIKRQAKGKLHSEQLNLPLGGQSAEEVMPQLQDWLYECPWNVLHENIKPRLIGAGIVQLTVYATDRESINRTENYLLKRLKK